MQLLLANSTKIASNFSKKIINLLKFSYTCIEISKIRKNVKYEEIFFESHPFTKYLNLKAKMNFNICEASGHFVTFLEGLLEQHFLHYIGCMFQ